MTKKPNPQPPPDPFGDLGSVLALAYPDRVAIRRSQVGQFLQDGPVVRPVCLQMRIQGDLVVDPLLQFDEWSLLNFSQIHSMITAKRSTVSLRSSVDP